MRTLIISGAPNCGKSELIHQTANHLLSLGYTPITDFHGNGFNPAVCTDIETLFAKDGKHVLLHSATDNKQCIDRLADNLLKAGVPLDVLVTSCRRDDPERQYLCTAMGWTNGITILDAAGAPIPQLPLLRIRYENYPVVLRWYQENLLGIVKQLLSQPPYNL